MLLIRATLALLGALIIVPATASADLRSPVVGETSLLSDVPLSRTYRPAIATDGNRTFVAYMEERTGITVNTIGAAGTEVGGARALQEYGTVSVEDPKVAVSGEHVYVAWIQGSLALKERHAVVAASHDGGRTWAQPVRAGNPTGHGAWDLQLAADGDTVFVAYTDNASRLWTAGSRDGGKRFTCFATVSEPGDVGREFDIAVDGEHVYWSWVSRGIDVMVRRSKDAGRTLEPVERVYGSGAQDRPGGPIIAADGGTVAVVFGQRFEMPREDRTGTDFGWEPRVASSVDGGASWGLHAVGGEATRCIGDYCAEYSLDVDGGRAYVGWRAKGKMWIAQGAHGFGGPRELGPYLYTWRMQSPPSLDAHGDSVVAVWHSAPNADTHDLDPVAAFSSDRGQTFTLRTLDTAAGKDMLPVVSAWGPEPEGAGFAWWSFADTWYTSDTHVKFVPMSSAEPDVAVADVRPFQVAQDAARLAAGRPTTIRATLHVKGATRRRVPVKLELAYDHDGQRVERTIEQGVIVHPGANAVQLLADEPIVVGQGRITAKVTALPEGGDSDPANNTGEGSRAVVQPRPLKILFVPVYADDEAVPACRDVQDVAEGTERYLEAAWPVDPATFTVVTDCASRLVHPAGITEVGLMEQGMLMSRIDRLKWSAQADKVVGVVPQGWFSRQLIEGFQNVIGIAPSGGGFDSAIVERQNTGGWIVAHELAHSLGREHLNDTPAPGYWVAEKRDIEPLTLDFLHHNIDGGDIASPTGRWTSKATWDFLTTELSTGVIQGIAGDGEVLSLTGSVATGGAVKAGPAFELDGQAEESAGPYTVEQLAADGTVLVTRGFGAASDLGPIGKAGAKPMEITTAVGAFSLRLPAHADARSLRIRRGDDVLHTRTRSAAAPAVKVATPERVQLGDDLKITWEASDADGDTLTSLVSISTDGGATWRSLGDATTARELTTKAIVTLAGADVRVRVTTTDGWNTAVSESGAFAVGGELEDGLVLAMDHIEGAFTTGLDGGGLKQLARTAYRPRWSPDGRKIAYDDLDDLFVMNADGSGQRKVTNAGSGEQYLWGVWSPDGDKVISMKGRNHSASGANMAIDIATGAETVFGNQGRLCEFSRDGSRLLGGHSWFTLYRADGTGGVPLRTPIFGWDCMSLSPDQRHGVVQGNNYDPAHRDILLWDLATGERRNLTGGQFGTRNQCPRFSPTGEWIVWSSNRDRDGAAGDIWKMRPDGTGAVKILDGAPDSRSWECADVQPLRGVAPDVEPTLAERDPAAKVAAASGIEGAAVELDARASRPGADDAAIASYAWDLDGDGTYTDATGATPKASFPDEGTYPVSVLVTDARGRAATATAEVTVTNAAPAITAAKLGDGNFTARVTDVDAVTASLFWNGSATGEPVTLIATGEGYQVSANRPSATSVRIEVADGDGGTASADAARVVAPANGAPAAADATAKVLAGESVDIALPATDPEGERLRYEIVEPPAQGSLQMRAESLDPSAPDVTYTAGDETGPVTFTYRVSDGTGTSSVATVTVDVTRVVADVPQPKPYEPGAPEPVRPSRTGSKPVDPRVVEQATAPAPVKASEVITLPSKKACVSRRKFTIHVKRGSYRSVLVHVNGKRVSVRRNAAGVDLRGLPKGRFKVTIAVTLKSGKVVKSTRSYRTCTPKKKGGRS